MDDTDKALLCLAARGRKPYIRGSFDEFCDANKDFANRMGYEEYNLMTVGGLYPVCVWLTKSEADAYGPKYKGQEHVRYAKGYHRETY